MFITKYEYKYTVYGLAILVNVLAQNIIC